MAGKLGVAPAGRFLSKLASAKLYGFIEKREGKLVVTPRGEELLSSDQAGQRKATREGVMSTGFAPVLMSLMGRTAEKDAVVARLAEDLGLDDEAAADRASTLLNASEDAELVSDGRFDVAAIEDTASVVGEVEIATAEGEKSKCSSAPTGTAKKESGARKAGGEGVAARRACVL